METPPITRRDLLVGGLGGLGIAMIVIDDESAGKLTLRDYFAVAALQALVSGQFLAGVLSEKKILDDLVEGSYKLADAMLEKRAE